MMVTFISQCEKNALKRTRRVLDAFANRIGDNTWQTVITQEGLLAVKKLLSKTASKSTAVSCHWLRSRSRTELLWVVGKRDKFDRQGRVPVNYTRVNRVLRDDSADWHYLPLIQALAAMAALLHDWGKASERFQQKLAPDYHGRQGDALRHEWVSCILLKAFIASADTSSDSDWLTRLAAGDLDEHALTSAALADIKKPLADLPPTAQLLAWLIVSHHRLPLSEQATGNSALTMGEILDGLTAEWGYQNRFSDTDLHACLRFPKGLVSESSRWVKALKRWAGKLLLLQPDITQVCQDGSYRLVLHHARLCLMLADHCYSSQDDDPSWRGGIELIANTKKDPAAAQGTVPRQTLDQHLVRVCDYAKSNVRNLPTFEKRALRSYAVSGLKKLSPYKKGQYDFRWQDTAVKKVRAGHTPQHGFFAVNMASTGCGKTFANAKVMRLLSEEGDSLRFVLALGLRTLTLQTGDEYRDKIFTEGDGSDLAVLIGSQAVAELHASGSSDRNAREALANSEEQALLQAQGSESQQSLLDASNQIEYDGEIPEEGLVTVLKRQKDRQFLHAPVLVCTLDHMMPATETTRGGRYILPSLRLMSSDLVIDEIDDFTDADSIAIGRLIHLAGMLGRKVMISSATITPAMAEGYFEAYRSGWQLYAKTHSAKQTVDCVWIDEFRTQVKPNTELAGESARLCYRDQHNDFVEKREKSLAAQAAKRKARILSCPLQREASEGDKTSTYFTTIAQGISSLHQQHHFTDAETGLNLSFGVVRMANINPCIALTRFLLDSVWADETEIRIMPYHSQQVLLLRNAQEQHLDAVLKRKEKAGESPQALSNRQIRQHLAQVKQMPGKKQLIFILVATPVEEVGRDHDFDWAIIEPSSYRSIIQMAGRVRRHRSGEVASENIGILQYNWTTFKDGDKRDKNYFYRPGYESNDKFRVNGSWKKLRCQDHDLSRLLDTAAIAKCLDSVPRIRLPKQGNPLAQLEHAAINYQLNSPDKGPESLHGYLTQNWFLTALPQKYNPFRQSEPRQQLYLALVDEEECFFVGKDDDGNLIRDDLQGNVCNLESINNINRIELTPSQQTRLWLPRDYAALVAAQAERTDHSLMWTSVRYGELSLREQQQNYIYNDQLGLFKDL